VDSPRLGGMFAPSGASRRTVTVLFCDVVDSTPLGERLDAETLRRLLGSYFDVARLVLERHGGTVEKFIGDAVMAVFGLRKLHDDDALRALRAAADWAQRLHRSTRS
jgi:class 3 adenylate cyclase